MTLITMKDSSTDFFATPAESGEWHWRIEQREASFTRGSPGHSNLLRTAFRPESRSDVVSSFVYITNVSVLLASGGVGTCLLGRGRTPAFAQDWTAPASDAPISSSAPPMLGRPDTPEVAGSGHDATADSTHRDDSERSARSPGCAGATPPGARCRSPCGRERLRSAHSSVRAPQLGLEGWRLVFGEGPAAPREPLPRPRCRGLRRPAGGQTNDPAEQMLSTCAIFSLLSRYEGFPNVLLEAMARGAAPVAFDCLSGLGATSY